jgi:hypothetical protein
LRKISPDVIVGGGGGDKKETGKQGWGKDVPGMIRLWKVKKFNYGTFEEGSIKAKRVP